MNRIATVSAAITLCSILNGCAGIKTRSEVAALSNSERETPLIKRPPVIEVYDEMADEEPVPAPTTLAKEVAPLDKKRIPTPMNASVEKWIKYFSEKDRERFQRFLIRGQKYREVVESVLDENDMPPELFYLAMIESGFRIEAHSHAKAKGIWQFIPGTATRYGLRLDRHVDERKDPIRSTEAAARYLRDLYNVFGSWHLAMAGYNAGEIRVLRAVFKGKSRDFWKLANAKALPRETAEYVPKFIAVAMIGANPGKYGFDVPDVKRYPNLEIVSVPGSVPFSKIAQHTKVSKATLKEFNPHLKDRTPHGEDYELWIPVKYVASIKSAHRTLEKSAVKPARMVASTKKSTGTIHIVRRGENLSVIARRHKISVGHLKRMNGLKSNKLFVGARLRIKAKSYRASKIVRYKVRKGDNLTYIAKRFKTTVKRVRALNKLRRNKILVGQVLRLEARL